ncbi:hypothetical protein Q9233_012866 [Columba guinea]|nr:hypothetical protein Q9233_012866 [Columba guinea]
MPLCLCVSAGRLTMISSVITYRASPCGLGAPSGAILMALGALLPFSIIMWTTGATAQSKTLQLFAFRMSRRKQAKPRSLKETQILETTSCMKPWGWRRRKRVEENETEDQQAGVGHTAAQTDPNCALEDKAEDGEVLDCKKRPDEGEELEEEAVHSCDSCLQVFESLSDITEHKINQCQLTGGVHRYLDYYQTYDVDINSADETGLYRADSHSPLLQK